MTKKLAIFDRDETLIIDKGYTYDVSELQWKPDILELLEYLTNRGIKVAVATNQSGINRGYFTSAEVDYFHQTINDYLRSLHINEMVFFVCPHLPSLDLIKGCNCRKPEPGLLLEAIEYFSLSKIETIFIGDKETDRQAAFNCGIDFLQADFNNEWTQSLKEIIK